MRIIQTFFDCLRDMVTAAFTAAAVVLFGVFVPCLLGASTPRPLFIPVIVGYYAVTATAWRMMRR